MLQLLGAIASAIGTGFVSAVFPAVNAEVATGVGAAVASLPFGVAWVAGIAVGQTIGKIVVYEAARAGKAVHARRRARKAATPASAMLDTPTSATSDPSPSATSDAAPSATSDAPSSATSDAPPSATSHTPSSATSDAPPSATSDAPSSGSSGAPPSATSDTLPPAMSDAPPSTTPDTPPLATSDATTQSRWARLRAWLGRTSQRLLALMDNRWRADAVLLLSASVGVPPLLATAAFAGVVKVRRVDFVVCVLVGRLARFFIVAAPFLALT
ncbi:MAG: hypothetical protein LBS56_08805 [Propionibacteriaceae bacterium]|jgi:membrane protein YqaA with SNARE-associated domain|nr:hypothetical protein [Propionibacteriaceae bacterium]